MTPEQVAQIKALVKLRDKASPGPWEELETDDAGYRTILGPDIKSDTYQDWIAVEDSSFIVAAHNAAPAIAALLAENEALRAETSVSIGIQTARGLEWVRGSHEATTAVQKLMVLSNGQVERIGGLERSIIDQQQCRTNLAERIATMDTELTALRAQLAEAKKDAADKERLDFAETHHLHLDEFDDRRPPIDEVGVTVVWTHPSGDQPVRECRVVVPSLRTLPYRAAIDSAIAAERGE